MFNVKNITKKYSDVGDVYRGYKDVSFRIKKGEVICILGESGSGKSALLKSLVDLEKPDNGSISFEVQHNDFIIRITGIHLMASPDSIRKHDLGT